MNDIQASSRNKRPWDWEIRSTAPAEERIIWLSGEVRDDNTNAICAQLLCWLQKKIPNAISTCALTLLVVP